MPSLLTQGLDDLNHHSAKLKQQLQQLYELDDELQRAHQKAKHDDEMGEYVVTKYTQFLEFRKQLITEVEKEHLQVPWQLRMRIDELDLTLRERKEKEAENKQGMKTAKSTNSATEKKGIKSEAEPQEETPMPPVTHEERVVVSLLVPTIVVLVIALIWYQWFM